MSNFFVFKSFYHEEYFRRNFKGLEGMTNMKYIKCHTSICKSLRLACILSRSHETNIAGFVEFFEKREKDTMFHEWPNNNLFIINVKNKQCEKRLLKECEEKSFSMSFKWDFYPSWNWNFLSWTHDDMLLTTNQITNRSGK